VFLAATVVTLGTAAIRHHTVPAVVLLGPLTYAIGGAAISVAARRAFAATQTATAAADAAEAEHRVALERWRARRASDRQLHDTVLATLTLLAHGAEGVSPARLRAWCERDLAILAADPGRPGEPEPHGHPYEASASGTLRWLETVLADHETPALRVLVHADRPVIDAVRLAPATARAVRDALRECLENVRRHAQVPLVEIAASVSARDLVLVVLDHGRGFDPADVPPDRMGLRVSVRERLGEVGGRVTVWSRPGEGASVVIRVPTQAPATAAPAGPAPVDLIPRQEQVT
jgi:signal transduction histidine kinase